MCLVVEHKLIWVAVSTYLLYNNLSTTPVKNMDIDNFLQFLSKWNPPLARL